MASVMWKEWSPAILRVALALVFLWFGMNQLLFPDDFMGYLPRWAISDQPGMMHAAHVMVKALPSGPYSLLFINGLFEVILGVLLLVGLFTRLSALLLGAHLLAITVSLGYNEIAVRDFGLALGTLAVAMFGSDLKSADAYMKEKLKRSWLRVLYLWD